MCRFMASDIFMTTAVTEFHNFSSNLQIAFGKMGNKVDSIGRKLCKIKIMCLKYLLWWFQISLYGCFGETNLGGYIV